MAYFEICQKIKDEKWKVDNQYPKNLGPHAFNDKQWVGYDDVDTFKMKADFIIQNGLGGAMVWTLDNDDFRGLCNGQQSPLITSLKESLFNLQSKKQQSSEVAIQPSSSVDKPVRTVSRSDTLRKQTNSRRPSFSFSNGQSSSSLSTTLSTTPSTTTTTTTTTTEPPTEVTSSEPEFTTPDPGVEFKCEDEGKYFELFIYFFH